MQFVSLKCVSISATESLDTLRTGLSQESLLSNYLHLELKGESN